MQSHHRASGFANAETPDVSIVIPARNEELRLGRTLDALLAAPFDWSVEVLVVDDGSTDSTVDVVARHAGRADRPTRCVRGPATGKGGALRFGVDQAIGRVIVLLDADLPVQVGELGSLVSAALTSSEPEILVGTRRHRGATNGQPAIRRLGGSGFLLVTRLMGYSGVSDPQCGLKALSGDAAHRVASQTRSPGFEWDLELVARAVAAGVTLREWPVEWIHRPGSTVRPVRDAARTLWRLAWLRPKLPKAR